MVEVNELRPLVPAVGLSADDEPARLSEAVGAA
jgi:hypothetical protein